MDPAPRPFLADPRARAAFDARKMGKATLFEGSGLFVGINAFEPGQEHAPHAHAGADKLYEVLEGRGEFTIGDATTPLERGALAFAPAGISHGVKNAGPGRLVLLVVMAPPPTSGARPT
jgi:quercetin dioxygenase-like cupin family protein